VGLFARIVVVWHQATEHRFERIMISADAAEALKKLVIQPDLKFMSRLARVDDEMGGYLGASDMIRKSIKRKTFCLWELERYCAALDPDRACIFVDKASAERCRDEFLPIFVSAKQNAEVQVAYMVANRRVVSAHDLISKQLWIAAISAVASAVAALASVVSAHGK
jgi:hypothetical protein